MPAQDATLSTAAFQRLVLRWYQRHHRDLPWRNHSCSPYQITVSEIMLQQTQIVRVLQYYPRFIKQLPSFRALAQAPLRTVLREWQGLGYNRRAKFLWELAQEVHRRHAGRLPHSRAELEALPGIGSYTAAALQVFVFNKPAVLIETNIRAVYLHHFFPGRRDIADRTLLPIIQRTIWRRDPRKWFYALMDYGSWLKRHTPGINKRSRHYRPQSKFLGSARELRGKVLREVLNDGPLSVSLLVQRSGASLTSVRKALSALTHEGLLKRVRAPHTNVDLIEAA